MGNIDNDHPQDGPVQTVEDVRKFTQYIAGRVAIGQRTTGCWNPIVQLFERIIDHHIYEEDAGINVPDPIPPLPPDSTADMPPF